MTTDEKVSGKLKVRVVMDSVASLLPVVLRKNSQPLGGSNLKKKKNEKIIRFKVWHIEGMLRKPCSSTAACFMTQIGL